MDTRSRKWTNKVLITLVMIAMTLSGIYGLDTIHNMAVTGDNSFSLDEQDQSDYIKNTQMSLFDKWADQEGDKVYYTQANHVSESLLNKIKKESFVKVTMKVKPYDKKMVTTTSTYGTENANYTGGRIEHFHIERGKTEKLNKDGSFKGWDPYDEYDEYNADQTEYYEFYGDNYTLQDIFPEQLLINDEKNQRLENADIEISLTKKALTEIENFRKGSTKQITTGIKTIIVVSIIEVIGTILLCILFALQEKRTRFFRGLDRLWWEIILVTATTLLGLAIALCFAIWEYTIEYTQGGITGSTIEMIMTENFRKGSTKQITTGIKTIIVVSIIEVIGTILLCILFALQEKRTRFFRGLDRLWWEIILVTATTLLGLAIALCFAIWEYTIEYTQGGITGSTIEMIMTLSYISVPFFIMAFAVCIQTTVWRIRQKNLLDSTFCLGYIRKWSRQAKTRRKLEDEAMSFAQKHARDRIRQYRVLRYILTVGTLACIIMGMSGMNIPSPLLFIAAVIFVFLIRYFSRYSDKYAKEQRDLNMLVDQIERISNGELTATTDISQESAYYEYSQKLTNIGQGMEKALETQMKGERMKIDLITNVSHDLKTPLTSIIGYVDLLSRDQTLSAESRDYVTILINKTERLKSIISDLFELAKATSGDAKVDLEEMDMKRLVEQTLGDMADQIEESGFAIRYQCEATHTRFIGDSSRMYRVVQNVIENALKYSLKGTRIFLRITEADQNIKLEVINTASYEMNFTEEEIMERFARAEKSRTSEGNGLGLSIADSFTKNCGGEFSIRIDGDQFLVTIQFKQHLDGNK